MPIDWTQIILALIDSGEAATTFNKVTITAPATSATITIADGKTFTASNTLTLSAIDGSTLNVGAGGTLGTGAYKDVGSSGNNLALMDGTNTWSGAQAYDVVATYVLLVGSDTSSNRYIAINAQASSQSAISFKSAGTDKMTLYRPGASDDLVVFSNVTSASMFRFGAASPNNVILGAGSSPTGGGQCLALSQASGNPSSIGSNTAGLVAKDSGGTCELYAWDEAGNVTLISPHALDGPEWLYDDDDPMPNVKKEENIYLGTRRWTNLSRQAKLVERMLAGENIAALPAGKRTFVATETFTPTENWDANQAAQTKTAADRVAQIDMDVLALAEKREVIANDEAIAWPEQQDAFAAIAAEMQSLYAERSACESFQAKPIPPWMAKQLAHEQ